MATSTKVQFNLDILRQKAVESLDHRIALAQTRLASYDDDEAMAQRVREWRQAQEAKLSELVAQLPEVDDYRLSKFSLDTIPSVEKWERREAENKLSHLQNLRQQVEAKSSALVPDEQGNISLTPTQLSEFFGL